MFTGGEIDERLQRIEKAVLFISQVLAESEQEQARTNIDAIGGKEAESLVKFMRAERMRREYLTFTGIEDGGTLSLVVSNDEGAEFFDDNILVSKNGGQWETVHFAGDGEYTLGVFNRGDRIRVKGDGLFSARYSDDLGHDAYFSFASDKDTEISGNVMSLYYGDAFSDKYAIADGTVEGLPDDYWMQCAHLFEGGENFLINPIHPLVLPATTLADNCYSAMFRGCTGLTSAPELPATTLANDCYNSMFSGCTGLTSAPELPATTLADNCYSYMFNGCTGLTSAPELPATTLANYCYSYMFNGCTGLTSAPELPATTLANNCYNSMFSGCTGLNYVKCLATNISASGSHTDWLKDVSATGTFVKAAGMNSWPSGSNGIPSGWTIQDAA